MYEVRYANLRDVDVISKIHTICWRECYPFIPEHVHQQRNAKYRRLQWYKTITHMKARKEPVIVLEYLGEVVGFANIKKNSDPDMPAAEYELHAWYLLAEHRGTLAGPYMLKALLENIQHHGASSFSVWVFSGNPMRITYRMAGLKRIIDRERELLGIKIPEIGMLADNLRKLANLVDTIIERKMGTDAAYPVGGVASQKRSAKVQTNSSAPVAPSVAA